MKRAFTHGNIASPRAWSWNRLCHQRGPRAMQVLYPRPMQVQVSFIHVASLPT